MLFTWSVHASRSPSYDSSTATSLRQVHCHFTTRGPLPLHYDRSTATSLREVHCHFTTTGPLPLHYDRSTATSLRQVHCRFTTTCPLPLHYDRSTATSQPVRHTVPPLSVYRIFLSLQSSYSCLPLLPQLPVTYFLPSIFPLIMCFRRQFLHKK